MKRNWKQVLAMLGVISMVSSQSTLLQVQASEVAVNAPAVTSEVAADTSSTISGNVPETKDAVITKTTADAENTDGLLPATNLRWSETRPGQIEFDNPNDAEVFFRIYIKKDGSTFMTWSTGVCGKGLYTLSSDRDIKESGSYTFQVETFLYGEEGDYDLSNGCVSEVSVPFKYVRPDAVIKVPQNIRWSSDGTVTWDAVDHTYFYEADLYKEDENGRSHVVGYGSGSTSRNFADEMAEGYQYYVTVEAYSENINLYAHSETSEMLPFDSKGVASSVNKTLSSITENVNADNIADTVNSVKDTFKDSKKELQIAMQTNDETQSTIANLENMYESTVGITKETKIAEDTGIDAGKVSILGASLNATEAGNVSFSMNKVDEETTKNLMKYTHYAKAIAFDMDLRGAGVEPGNLAIPVTITMPAPAGIDVSKLVILHYSADGSSEFVDIRQNADGTISFTVTHFSNFVFAEKAASGDGGSGMGEAMPAETSDENVVHYETASGESVVVTPAWKPTTPDEKKRYAVVGKEKVSYTADAANTYSVTIKNAMQGKLCFDVFESVLGDYTIGRTYNILPNGKRAYAMNDSAAITLTIPKELQAEGRQFKMICVTENGIPVVLEDLDKSAETITFKTNTYYAFALVYKDAK